MDVQRIDRILSQLAKDIETTVETSVREDKRAAARLRLEQLAHEARTAIVAAVNAPTPSPSSAGLAAPRISSPQPRVSAPMVAGTAFGWNDEDSEAVLKCILSWLPLAGPASTPPDSKCIAAGKLLIPTWGERERARGAVKLITEK